MQSKFNWERVRLLWECLRFPEAQTVLKNPCTRKKPLESITQKGNSHKLNNKKVKTITAMDSDDDIESEEEKCCVCGKFFPEKSDYDHINIVQRGQCDTCNKWVHLKFCTRVKVLRRGDSFLCPTCCKAEE
ncbi:hypothetical protein DPMN_033961 [Dreissena polymorpha]|uniref:Uncharacterized protein n=1 Tax=Dreissena polymorpha TaxID=45954 RepID=A0A9D4M705_DREPO|nr:hypothetical protein DPMN_033961 [Dreissena polymorpha]